MKKLFIFTLFFTLSYGSNGSNSISEQVTAINTNLESIALKKHTVAILEKIGEFYRTKKLELEETMQPHNTDGQAHEHSILTNILKTNNTLISFIDERFVLTRGYGLYNHIVDFLITITEYYQDFISQEQNETDQMTDNEHDSDSENINLHNDLYRIEIAIQNLKSKISDQAVPAETCFQHWFSEILDNVHMDFDEICQYISLELDALIND